MSSNVISEQVEPIRMAKHREQISGVLPWDKLVRIQKLIGKQQSTGLSVSLSFELDEESYCVIKGNIQAEVQLQCQACMKEYAHQVAIQFAVAPVETKAQIEQLPNAYEPVMLTAGKLALIDMIEDEIILDLPLVPRHAEDDPNCVPRVMQTERSEAESSEQPKNPFSVLKDLKKTR